MTSSSVLSLIKWRHLFLVFLLVLLQITGRLPVADAAGGGRWALLQQSIGIVAMHMQLLHTDKVVIFDRTDFGRSNISLPRGHVCRPDAVVKLDCTAHSVEYDVGKNVVRPLFVETDVWCSSGSVLPDGTLVQTGGFNRGDRVVRSMAACGSGGLCDWRETKNGLLAGRWYATNHALPGNRQIVIGGRQQFNFEFYPKTAATNKLFDLPFLRETNDRGAENNLYPLVILNTDGTLFIFANNRAILLNYATGRVTKTYPALPDGNPRSYPSTGSGLLLPLKPGGAAEVLVCGGAPKGAYYNAGRGVFVGALNTCGRISINAPNPVWFMETMPLARLMGDMLLMPNGHVLIINGAARGSAGWELGRDPVLSPVLYKPDALPRARFEVLAPATKPRMYHSSAILLRDGRVLVGGSNPHSGYLFRQGTLYPTELALEAFSPAYLDRVWDPLRPRIILPGSGVRVGLRKPIVVQFTVTGAVKLNLVKVTLVSPTFTTHSVSMNQRLLVLGGAVNNVKYLGKALYQATVNSPFTANFAPPGFYLLYVVHQDIPSAGIWVQIV